MKEGRWSRSDNRLNQSEAGQAPGWRVLLLDEQPDTRLQLQNEFHKAGWQVEATDTLQSALRLLSFDPDGLVMHASVLDEELLVDLGHLLDKLAHTHVPFILLSGDERKEMRLFAYDAGVDDYIVTPCEWDVLLSRLERQFRRKRKLDGLLLFDELTGAYNRRFLQRAYDWSVARMQRNNNSFTMALIDLDDFKMINDRYGHLIGDEALRKFASQFRSMSRLTDYLVRYGGEEFVAIFPDTAGDAGCLVLERLQRMLEREPLYSGDEPIPLSFSAGVVEVGSALRLEQWLDQADRVLYTAKQTGKSKVLLADSHPS